MRIINDPTPNGTPDFVNERDVFGLIKPKGIAIIKRFRYKSKSAPDLKVTYAGLGIRTLAAFIDITIVLCILLIPEVIFFSFNFNNLNLDSYRFFLGLFIWIFYNAAFESSVYQATIGKMILKIKVIDLYGKSLSIARAIFRCITVFISILPAGLGFWYMSTDLKKQGWHDLISGSYVIKIVDHEHSDFKNK